MVVVGEMPPDHFLQEAEGDLGAKFAPQEVLLKVDIVARLGVFFLHPLRWNGKDRWKLDFDE